jgi:RES domain-containing protein
LTPDHLSLDPSILFEFRQITLYRLARAKYANLSGAGAAQSPGRWNRPGQEAIYTSTEAGVPLLERLVHTPKDLIPSNLALMKLSLNPNRLKVCLTLEAAQNEFRNPNFPPDFAVALPSVIVPVWNVVLYPRMPGFWDNVTLESVDPFDFDPRLFPESTPLEA